MIELGPQGKTQLKKGDYLAAFCLTVQLGATWKLTNSGKQILDFEANGILNDIEQGVLDGSPSGENKTFDLSDPDKVLYADALANGYRNKPVVLKIALLHSLTYNILDNTLYEEFRGYIDSLSFDNGVLTLVARNQEALAYQAGRRSNDASIKSHFANDTSHEHMPNLPAEIKWGSITL